MANIKRKKKNNDPSDFSKTASGPAPIQRDCRGGKNRVSQLLLGLLFNQITFSMKVIKMMVNRMKTRDLTNQAIQCSQLGNPIIFMDSYQL